MIGGTGEPQNPSVKNQDLQNHNCIAQILVPDGGRPRQRHRRIRDEGNSLFDSVQLPYSCRPLSYPRSEWHLRGEKERERVNENPGLQSVGLNRATQMEIPMVRVLNMRKKCIYR